MTIPSDVTLACERIIDSGSDEQGVEAYDDALGLLLGRYRCSRDFPALFRHLLGHRRHIQLVDCPRIDSVLHEQMRKDLTIIPEDVLARLPEGSCIAQQIKLLLDQSAKI